MVAWVKDLFTRFYRGYCASSKTVVALFVLSWVLTFAVIGLELSDTGHLGITSLVAFSFTGCVTLATFIIYLSEDL